MRAPEATAGTQPCHAPIFPDFPTPILSQVGDLSGTYAYFSNHLLLHVAKDITRFAGIHILLCPLRPTVAEFPLISSVSVGLRDHLDPTRTVENPMSHEILWPRIPKFLGQCTGGFIPQQKLEGYTVHSVRTSAGIYVRVLILPPPSWKI
ncbi:hypothetical protein Y032_0739g1962 [Ancylostoma ceylanicum]|uniref:Uncharacterized protein n=1 Tax=Ancylostoma ceylanicum TaxID=53326 RepID=A0A016WEA0_9BILA|nr:hypothetical protein Y032_0739g1962 [Ancylostoma ceylanicum]